MPTTHATFMIPVLALAPSFFAGKIEYGDIVQTSIAFHQIFGAREGSPLRAPHCTVPLHSPTAQPSSSFLN